VAYTHLLQDWTRIKSASTSTMVQSADRWVDVSRYRDLTAFVSVAGHTGDPDLAIQTAPGPDAGLFRTLGPAIKLASPEQIEPRPFETTSVPLAKYLRWAIIPAGVGFDVTFRVYLSYTLQYGEPVPITTASSISPIYRRVMQELTHVRGLARATTIQSETDWLDLEPYEDLKVSVWCTQATTTDAGTTLTISTAPAPQQNLFQSMGAVTLVPNSLSTLTFKYATAAVPLSRFIRWSVVHATQSYTAQFYVVIAASKRGAILPRQYSLLNPQESC